MKRSSFIKGIITVPALAGQTIGFGNLLGDKQQPKFSRVRPGDPGWPKEADWQRLNELVKGNLLKAVNPFPNAGLTSKQVHNPYFLSDTPELTQTSGWLDAWTSKPSAYVLAARNAEDVAQAVLFAKQYNLRIVVKGGGHSYQGTSNAPDSLLIWTKHMHQIQVLDQFVPAGSTDNKSFHAVTVEAGALWMQVYDEVTTKNKRYVQGGGCATVGVAGLIQSGGFGSFSKRYGTAASSLLEAEVVTADGQIVTANEFQHPELFWALKGGGGGSFGIVMKLTLKTHELPEQFGAVTGLIEARSNQAYKKLVAQFIPFYHDNLFNEHWGEQARFSPGYRMRLNMLFQGLTRDEAMKLWQPFISWVENDKANFTIKEGFSILAIPAQHLWDADFLSRYASTAIGRDDRPDQPANHIFWSGDQNEAGQFLYAYHSTWVPGHLLEKRSQAKLVNCITEAARHWTISFHFNKGLAGAPEEAIARARNTAMNPKVCEAFALLIVAGEGESLYLSKRSDSDLKDARMQAAKIDNAFQPFRQLIPDGSAYVSESNYFQKNWQQDFWGLNYSRLLSVKKTYDPDNLFFIRHGVGSEGWSDDGFTRF